jgi:hypothetical protein
MIVIKKLEIAFLDILMRTDSNGLEILDEQVIYRNNNFIRVKRWIKGRHPELGKIIWGHTGVETLVETDLIIPTQTFFVESNEVGDSDEIHGWGFRTYG